MESTSRVSCYFCGGPVEESRGHYETRRKGQFYFFENVPFGQCKQCGEKYFHSEVLKVIDKILEEPRNPEKTVSVPVFNYESKVA